MPRIWLDFAQFLTLQCKVTRTRRLFDRALRALPITQHDKIWPVYLKFVRSLELPELACRVYRRYLKFAPEAVEEYIDYLFAIGRINEAAGLLVKQLDDEKFVSRQGKNRHALWLQLCEILSKNPTKVTSVKSDRIIRSGIRTFTNEVGRLWNALAEFYIRQGQFEKARDIFEEGINTVMTVRDFSMVYDAYTQFEDQLISCRMEEEEEGVARPAGTADDGSQDLDLLLARFEYLMDRRPLLVSSVLLRQNPHNVHEWLKRTKLFPNDPAMVVETFVEAIRTVDITKAVGKPQTLWIAYAKFYEEAGDIDNARKIFESSLQVPFRTVNDLAHCYIEYTELELRLKNFDKALAIMQRGAAGQPLRSAVVQTSVQQRLYKCIKLWAYYADLEESLGTFASTKAVYDRILDLKIATPQIILNYAAFLEENKYFEESFKAYERGIAMFQFPYVLDIWRTYLAKFIGRFQGTKLERARDLFEQALEKVPAKNAKELYLQYAELEEKYGQVRHAMNIYDRATAAVDDDNRLLMFNIYIKKAGEFFGVTKTREIFERAIEVLPDKHIREVCERYAEIERTLGEIDRARAIYVHASQFCDPRVHPDFWKTWDDFEVRHGNPDTFREMLRINRSVTNLYAESNYNAAAFVPEKPSDYTALSNVGKNDIEILEQLGVQSSKESAGLQGPLGATFVSAGIMNAKSVSAANPNAINIDLGEDEEEEDEEEKEAAAKEPVVEELPVPAAVLGGTASSLRASSVLPPTNAGVAVVGARERFKRARE